MTNTRREFLKGAGGGAVVAAAVSAQGAEAQAQAPSPEHLLPRQFNVAGDGSRDDAEAFQAMLDAAISTGRPVHVPAGRYRIGRTLRLRANDYLPYARSFARGPSIVGAGSGLTEIIAAGDGPVFDLGTDADYRSGFRASRGALIQGLTISGDGGRAGGIRIQSATHCLLSDLHIIGLGGNAVEIVCQHGDNDGSNMVSLERVKIENIGGWGLDAACGPGFNETSFIALRHVFFQQCGTAAQGFPSSGGMRWKGQICTLDQCAFTNCHNVALLVPGQAGLAQTLQIQETAFENNHGRHLLCTGITAFKARNVQFYSNDAFPASVACEFEASQHTVRAVEIDGAIVRATAGNRAFTAFKISGPHAEYESCRVRNVVWENFDYPGQTRFAGFLFDDVRQCCVLRVNSPSEATFGIDPEAPRGNKTPLRLRGGGGGAPSTSGEWIAATIQSDLVLSNRGLGAGREYNVYLFDDDGVRRLVALAEPAILDRQCGYMVNSGDRSRLFVGTVRTDARGGFVTGA